MDTKKLHRSLQRLTKQKEQLESRHVGNEQNYTYHGGFSLGYIKGQISIIENLLDEVGVDIDAVNVVTHADVSFGSLEIKTRTAIPSSQ